MALSLLTERLRTRRVDKGKSGQAQTTAVSGGFGGGILSRIISKRLTLLGERSGACDAVERAIIAELLIVVLTGLGGASQEKSAARIFCAPNSLGLSSALATSDQDLSER
jgi:hypothetical protein